MLPVKHDVKRPSCFTGNVSLATRYTAADSVVYTMKYFTSMKY